MADLANEEKPAIAPPVFVFQKDKAQKRSAEGSSPEGGEDSDKDDGSYCPPVKRERASSLTQFPPSHSVSKNNVFMPSSFCQSPTGNSDSEPEEKTVGFRLKPPTLIHGQAPSTVMRTQGSLRLILNTKLWSQMQIDKASEKSIRITAMDTEDQGVKVFLISASSNDTGQLYAALHHRIQALRSRAEQEQETKSIPAEPEVPQSNEEDSDEDDILAPAGSATASGSTDPGEAQATGST